MGAREHDMADEHENPVPAELELDRRRELRIRWADGRASRYPLARLRAACPCATCRGERREAGDATRLPIVAASDDAARMVTAESAELVGSYALRIRWADGHQTGIYDFALLRRLDGEQTP